MGWIFKTVFAACVMKKSGCIVKENNQTTTVILLKVWKPLHNFTRDTICAILKVRMSKVLITGFYLFTTSLWETKWLQHVAVGGPNCIDTHAHMQIHVFLMCLLIFKTLWAIHINKNNKKIKKKRGEIITKSNSSAHRLAHSNWQVTQELHKIKKANS